MRAERPSDRRAPLLLVIVSSSPRASLEAALDWAFRSPARLTSRFPDRLIQRELIVTRTGGGRITQRFDVYMSGALSDLTKDEYENLTTQIYDRVARICEEVGLTCYRPHRSSTTPTKGMPHSKVWKVDFERVSGAGLVVAYIGKPSLGVGAEIEMARTAGVPVILLCEGNRQEGLSRLILGEPVVKETIIFDAPEEIDGPLLKALYKGFSLRNLDVVAEDEGWPHSDYKRLERVLTTEVDGDKYRNQATKPISKDEWKVIHQDIKAKRNGK